MAPVIRLAKVWTPFFPTPKPKNPFPIIEGGCLL